MANNSPQPQPQPPPRPRFQIPVWEYSYTLKKAGVDITLHSPQKNLPEGEKKSFVLRQTNSDAANKAWLAKTSSEFERVNEDSKQQLYDDSHGIILCDGKAKPLDLDGEDDSAYVQYSRGDRIWVHRNMSPQLDVGDEIPVIDLDTKEAFKIPVKLICFAARVSYPGDPDDPNIEASLAVAVGPVMKSYPKEKSLSQLFFVWPADAPEKVTGAWDVFQRGRGRNHYPRKFEKYVDLVSMEERRQIFDLQWATLSKQLGIEMPHHLPGRDPPRAFASAKETIEIPSSSSPSNASSAGLDTRWKPGPITMENCCNLAPNCKLKFEKGIDLVPTTVGGHSEVEHYHVQDDDTDECPEGAKHKGHCVLRDDRKRCVFSRDIVDHTCCKLQTNPELPGPTGDPDDPKLLAWETTAGDEHFIDVSKNVRTRSELNERDKVPPQLREAQEEKSRLEQDRENRDAELQRLREQHRQRHVLQNQEMGEPRRKLPGQGVSNRETPAGPSTYAATTPRHQIQQNSNGGRAMAPCSNSPTGQPVAPPILREQPTLRSNAGQLGKLVPLVRQDHQFPPQHNPYAMKQAMPHLPANQPGPSNQHSLGNVPVQYQQHMRASGAGQQPAKSPHTPSPQYAPYPSMESPMSSRRSSLEAIPEHQEHNASPAPRYIPQHQYSTTGQTGNCPQVPSEKARGKSPQIVTSQGETPPPFLLPGQGREHTSPAPSPPNYRWDRQASQSPIGDPSPFFSQAVTDAARASLSPACRSNVSYPFAPQPNTLPPLRIPDSASMPPPRSPYSATSSSGYNGESSNQGGHRRGSGSSAGF